MRLFDSLPGIDRLPVNLRAVVAVGLLPLVGAGGYFGLVAPKLREVTALKAELTREVEAVPSLGPVRAVSPITDGERRLWAELEDRLRGRYPAEPALPRAMGVVAALARASGLELVSLEIRAPEPAGAAERGKVPAGPPFQPPPELGVNPLTIKLAAHHRYRDLVSFMEGLPRIPVYVAVQSLEVKRGENRSTSEIALASFRWGR